MQAHVEWWFNALVRGSIDAVLLSMLLTAFWWPLRRRLSPAFACGLFLLIPIKLLVPWELAGPKLLADISPRHVFDRLSGGLIASAACTEADLLTSIVVALWFAIASLLVARTLWTQRRLHNHLRGSTDLDDHALGLNWAALCRELGFRRRINCFAAPDLPSPSVFGLWQPAIYLPMHTIDDLSVDQRRWILMHELAHIARGDLWLQLVQRLARVVYFFHPAVWLVDRIIDQQREFACDDWALARSQGTRRSYGAGFLAVVERVCGTEPAPSMLTFFSDPALLRTRLVRILDSRRPVARQLSKGAVFGLVLLALLVLPGFRHEATQEPSQPAVVQVKDVIEQPLREGEPVELASATPVEDEEPLERPKRKSLTTRLRALVEIGLRIKMALD